MMLFFSLFENQNLNPWAKTFIPLIILVIPALSCGRVSQDVQPIPSEEGSLQFQVLDPVNHGIEGDDTVSVRLSKGVAESIKLFISTDGGSFYTEYPLEQDNDNYSLTRTYNPFSTKWYISATGLGLTTNHGSFRSPLSSEKYINKSNADTMIKNRMNELRSSGKISVYQPLSETDTSHTFGLTLNSGTQNVNVDHYIEILNSPNVHHRYVIQYIEAINDDGSSKREVPAINSLFSSQTNDSDSVGFIVIYSTETNSLIDTLSHSLFFPDRKSAPPYLYEY